jgi:hypothetical protein
LTVLPSIRSKQSSQSLSAEDVKLPDINAKPNFVAKSARLTVKVALRTINEGNRINQPKNSINFIKDKDSTFVKTRFSSQEKTRTEL